MKKFDSDPVVDKNDLDHYVRIRWFATSESVPCLALVGVLSLSLSKMGMALKLLLGPGLSQVLGSRMLRLHVVSESRFMLLLGLWLVAH